MSAHLLTEGSATKNRGLRILRDILLACNRATGAQRD